MDLLGLSAVLRRLSAPLRTSSASAGRKADVDLRLCVNAEFFRMLAQAPYQHIDAQKDGVIGYEDFAVYFSCVASEEELRFAFDVLRHGGDRDYITYGTLQSFQQKHDAELVANRKPGRVGCPDYLEYFTLLLGIRTSCMRPDFLALDGAAIPPRPGWLLQQLLQEWTRKETLRLHWRYVTQPVPERSEERRFPDWNGGFSVRDTGHEGFTVQDFLRCPEARQAGLCEAEVLALRLYTGPGYELLNRSLRANSQRFPVTQYCIDSAVGKLAQQGVRRPLLRGMKKCMHPRWVRRYDLYRGVGEKRLSLSDPAFVSCTTDLDVAVGSNFGGPVMFLLHTADCKGQQGSFLSLGAELDWVSQYPGESEVLLPSNAIFIPHLRCKHTRDHGLDVPPAKHVYEFDVFYPWDFEHNCPLVTNDYLAVANQLLLLQHEAELLRWQACRDKHPLHFEETLRNGPPPPSRTLSPAHRKDLLDQQATRRKSPAQHSSSQSPSSRASVTPTHKWADEAVPSPVRCVSDIGSCFSEDFSCIFVGDRADPVLSPGHWRPAPPPTWTDRSLSIKSNDGRSFTASATAGGLRLDLETLSDADLETLPSPVSTASGSLTHYLALAVDLPTDPPVSADPPPLAGTDARRLKKLKLYTLKDVVLLEKGIGVKPVANDGLEALAEILGSMAVGAVGTTGTPSTSAAVGATGTGAPGATGAAGAPGTGAAGATGAPGPTGTSGATAAAGNVPPGAFPDAPSLHSRFEHSAWDMGAPMFVMTGIALAIGLPTGLVGGLCTVVNLLAILASIVTVVIAAPLATLLHSGNPHAPVVLLTHTPTVTVTPTHNATSSPTPTPTLTLTTSPSATLTGTATQTSSATALPSRSPTATRTATVTSTASGTLTHRPTGTNSPSPSATPTPTTTLTFSATATGSRSPTATRTASSSHTETCVPTATSTPSSSATLTDTATTSVSATATGSYSPTPTHTRSLTPSLTQTSKLTVTATSSLTPTASSTSTQSRTRSPTQTATSTESATSSQTDSKTRSATATVSRSATPTATRTYTGSCTNTLTPTATATSSPTSTVSSTSTQSRTTSPSRTATSTQSSTSSDTASGTSSATGTASHSATPSATHTPTSSVTQTHTPTATTSPSPSATLTATATQTALATDTATGTRSSSSSRTRTSTTTATVTSSPTPTASSTSTQSRTRSLTQTATSTQSSTSSETTTRTSSATGTASHSATPTSTQTRTGSRTQTHTPTATRSASRSATLTGTATQTRSTTATSSQTVSPTRSRTHTPSETASDTPTASQTSSATLTQTQTASSTVVPVICALNLASGYTLTWTTTDSSFKVGEIDLLLKLSSVTGYGVPVVGNSYNGWTVYLSASGIQIVSNAQVVWSVSYPNGVVVADGKWHYVTMTGSSMSIDGTVVGTSGNGYYSNAYPDIMSWPVYAHVTPSGYTPAVSSGGSYELALVGMWGWNSSTQHINQVLRFSASAFVATSGPFTWTASPSAAITCAKYASRKFAVQEVAPHYQLLQTISSPTDDLPRSDWAETAKTNSSNGPDLGPTVPTLLPNQRLACVGGAVGPTGACRPTVATDRPRASAGSSAVRRIATLHNAVAAPFNLTPAMMLMSPDGLHRARVTSLGLLVVERLLQGDWIASWTAGDPAAGPVPMSPSALPHLAVQRDGDAVLYDARGAKRWAAGTVGYANVTVAVVGSQLAIRSHGAAVWARPL